MSDDSPTRSMIALRAVGGLLLAIVIVGLLFPAISIERSDKPTPEAKSCVIHLSAALKAYQSEYGKWPDFTGDGLFLDAERQAQLMRVLCAQDEINNPHKIVFFEGRPASKRSGKYCSGFHPETGAFLDTWGNPYRIAFDSDNDQQIANPYSDDPPIQAGVIVWSLGKDGKQGSPANPHTSKGSDDVTSWQ